MDRAGIDAAEAARRSTGAGFAVYVPAAQAERVVETAQKHALDAWTAGRVESGSREVVIEPLAVRYGDDSLVLRT